MTTTPTLPFFLAVYSPLHHIDESQYGPNSRPRTLSVDRANSTLLYTVSPVHRQGFFMDVLFPPLLVASKTVKETNNTDAFCFKLS